MKNLFLILLTCIPVFSFGQKTEGEIVFEEKVNLHMNISGEMEKYLEMIPEYQSTLMTLYFKDNVSLYKLTPDEEAGGFEHTSADGSMELQFKTARPENILYRNIAEGTKVEQNEFMGKKFLISGDSKYYDWKMSNEQKEIQGHMCQKAMYQDSLRSVEAWFTPEIPVASGPGSFGQLPGMILEVNIDNGARLITASKIDFHSVQKTLFKKPSKGKPVSTEEFSQIQEEKLKELDAQRGKGGAIMIIEERH